MTRIRTHAVRKKPRRTVTDNKFAPLMTADELGESFHALCTAFSVVESEEWARSQRSFSHDSLAARYGSVSR